MDRLFALCAFYGFSAKVNRDIKLVLAIWAIRYQRTILEIIISNTRFISAKITCEKTEI
jgi:hypothetical protein